MLFIQVGIRSGLRLPFQFGSQGASRVQYTQAIGVSLGTVYLGYPIRLLMVNFLCVLILVSVWVSVLYLGSGCCNRSCPKAASVMRFPATWAPSSSQNECITEHQWSQSLVGGQRVDSKLVPMTKTETIFPYSIHDHHKIAFAGGR